ncbi:hypothetical protein [Gordonia rhizosphera]|uniref:Phasin domain-containing protein n=1 Tax=Gordonia rhizosphera NBRC 16068 TaxID=1108045 RepID=K6W937_9ACTN|nr:hypothetical protein [Gordonia rhizosphera]GAB90261.1 hypothetical protein GORHZ_092_00100 [Gordonia rhizosphera NBRC 16068]
MSAADTTNPPIAEQFAGVAAVIDGGASAIAKAFDETLGAYRGSATRVLDAYEKTSSAAIDFGKERFGATATTPEWIEKIVAPQSALVRDLHASAISSVRRTLG